MALNTPHNVTLSEAQISIILYTLEDYMSSDRKSNDPDYQPDLYYYWDSPIEEDYDWRKALPNADCLCEICFDILNTEGKIKWH